MIEQVFLLDEPENEPIKIGLLSLVYPIPDEEFFFHINKINTFQVERVEDLVYNDNYFEYYFSVFKGYCEEKKVEYTFISNCSTEVRVHKPISELFFEETDIKFLLKSHREVEFLIKTSDTSPDFSSLLMPESKTFAIKEIEIDEMQGELYNILNYYE